MSPTPAGRAYITVEDYSTTKFAVNWDDDEGAATTQAIHFEIGVAPLPEPTTASLLAIFGIGLTIRRRRSN
jgi:hypothetical protein